MVSLDDILTSHRTRRPIVMGVLNVTPDSFSDGGAFDDPVRAADHIQQMVCDGADIIDIGAESTRPGADRVGAREQIQRLGDSVTVAAETGAIVSIDTTSAEVAGVALDQGASLVNDVSAGRDDPELLAVVAERNVPVILMHMLGQPKSMQSDPQYDDVVSDVFAFLSERIEASVSVGVAREKIIVDPGIGFGKRLEHNVALLGGVPALLKLDCPVLIGASRKRCIGELTGEQSPADRAAGSIAAVLTTYALGATIFRVHDVSATRQALAVAQALQDA